MCSAATPCDGIDRTLTDERRALLARALAKQLNTSRVDVLQSFRSGEWQIVYVDTHDSDESFLFFHADPLVSRYVTRWGGAAARFEEQAVREWTIKNAPRIPRKLASCFAWHVTQDRDK
jgi:hypothetical protein